MIYGDIIHPEILKALSEAGHGTNIVIADGNFPADIGVPDTAKKVFLNLAPDKMKVTDVLKEIVKAVNIESAAAPVMDTMEDAPVFPEMCIRDSPCPAFQTYGCADGEDSCGTPPDCAG